MDVICYLPLPVFESQDQKRLRNFELGLVAMYQQYLRALVSSTEHEMTTLCASCCTLTAIPTATLLPPILPPPPPSQTDAANQRVDLDPLRAALGPRPPGPVVPSDLTQAPRGSLTSVARRQIRERRAAAQCLGELAASLWHFNYRSDLLR